MQCTKLNWNLDWEKGNIECFWETIGGNVSTYYILDNFIE